jgi:uracil-DNA glycosylase
MTGSNPGDSTDVEFELETLLADIRACRHCAPHLAHEPRPVVRAGRGARLLIAGQAPGVRVHQSGIPWNDPSGERLRDWLAVDRDCFYDENRIALVPQGFCFPGTDPRGGDYPPRPECAKLWHGRLVPLLDRVEFTLCLGLHAQRWHLGRQCKKNLTETVRHWRDYLPDYLPLPHPSWRNSGWIKRNPWFETDLLPYLRGRIKPLIADQHQ